MTPVEPSARCRGAFSRHPKPAAAVGEALGVLLEQVEPHPSLAVVWASGSHRDELDAVVAAVGSILGPEILLGVPCATSFAGVRDARARSGVTIWVLHQPGLRPIALELLDDGSVAGRPSDLAPGSTVLLAAERTFPPAALGGTDTVELVALVESGPGSPQPPMLIHHGEARRGGALGVVFPPGACGVFDFAPDDTPGLDGEPVVPDHLVEVGDAEAALLFPDTDRYLTVGLGPDFDLVLERFSATFAGQVGRRYRSTAARPEVTEGVGATALVVR